MRPKGIKNSTYKPIDRQWFRCGYCGTYQDRMSHATVCNQCEKKELKPVPRPDIGG